MTRQASYIAGADLSPSTFVKNKAGEDNAVTPCGAGDVAIGIVHEAAREAPIPNASALAAKAGESCNVYGPGDPCEVIAGAAVAAGDLLKPDANAQAVPAVATDKYSAVARTSAAVGEKVKCVIVRGVA